MFTALAPVEILGEELAWSLGFLSKWGDSLSSPSQGPVIQDKKKKKSYLLLPFVVPQSGKGELCNLQIKYNLSTFAKFTSLNTTIVHTDCYHLAVSCWTMD